MTSPHDGTPDDPRRLAARARPHRPGWLPDVDASRCTGCGWCVAACEHLLLSLEVVQWRKLSTLHDADRCTGCSDCAVVCPFHVITMRKAVPARSGTGQAVEAVDRKPAGL